MPLQLGLGLNRRLGGFNPFNPTHLNPHLLFDTRTSMLGELESPTLDLDPAVPSSLDVITATRAGVATYTDIDGNIQSADPNTVRVDYTQGEELTPTVYQNVTKTDFSSLWLTYRATINVQPETLNGNAILRWTTTGGYAQVKQNIETEEGKTYTYSFYVRLISNDGGNQFRAWTQNSTSAQHPSIALTENWQKVVVTFEGRTGGGVVGIGLTEAGTHTVSNVLEYSMPQVVDGEIEYDFVPNTTGSPKFITGAKYGPRVPMMLIEPSATNLVANTNFSDWTSRDVSVTDGAGYKGQTSKIITRIAGSFQSLFYYLFDAGDYTFSTEHTGSFWIRKVAGTNTQITIDFYRASSSQSSTINLTEEWQKVEIAITSPSSAWFRFGLFFAPSQTSLGDSVEIAMPQVEEGSVATSYIPTSGSTVTRNADNLVIDGTDFTDFYNATEGTFYVESVTRVDDNVAFLFDVNNGETQRNVLYYNNPNNLRALIRKDNTTSASLPIGSRPSAGVLSRAAFGYANNNLKGSLDGGVVASDTSVTPPTTVNEMTIGCHLILDNLYYINGHLKRLIYWPTHSDSL